MSIAVYELNEAVRTQRSGRQLERRSRRGVPEANDFRRPPVRGAEYREVRGVHGRPDADSEARVQAPGLLVTLAACLLTALVVVGLFGLWNWRVGGPGAVEATTTVQVQAGETLSDVAARVAPGVPVADVVGAMLDLNDLSSVSVHPGQMLLAPAPVQ